MLSCNCTLPYINPDACKNCPTYINYMNSQRDQNDEKDIYPHFNFLKEKKIKKYTITKEIEKYGENLEFLGKEIIKETIEEEIPDDISPLTFSFSSSSTDGELNDKIENPKMDNRRFSHPASFNLKNVRGENFIKRSGDVREDGMIYDEEE